MSQGPDQDPASGDPGMSEEAVIEGLSPDARTLYTKLIQLEKGKLHISAASTSLVEEIGQLVKGLRP